MEHLRRALGGRHGKQTCVVLPLKGMYWKKRRKEKGKQERAWRAWWTMEKEAWERLGRLSLSLVCAG